MSDSTPRRKLAAILAADVVGFSKKMGENEDRTLHNLKICRAITDESIETYHGRVFGSAGDSVIAEFASPVDAIVAAVEFQRNLRDRNEAVPPEDRMQFRVGLNIGDVIVEGDNLFGDGVNVAARLEPLAEPGGILVSGKFHDEVRRKLDLSFMDKGAQEMKNIEDPVPTFRVELGNASEVLQAFAVSSPPPQAAPAEPEEPSKPPAIAVMPFTNMSGDPEQEYFADGITEDIITNLSLWKTFPVISRNSSFTYKGKSVNLKEVAEELGVRYIVEGSVRKGGSKVRITAQLIDATEDHHLWSERWDRSLDDIFEVQDEVSSAIAALVSPAVKGQEQDRVIRKPTKNLNAWDEYLRGLAILNSDGDLEKAKAHGYKSIELDPRLSDAYILVGQCLRLGELYNPEKQDQREAIETEFHEKAKKAFELDPKNPEALIILSVSANIKRNFEQRAELMKKALAINPNHAVANHEYGLSITAFGEFEKAKQHVLKSIELNPTSANQQFPNIGLMLCYLGLRDFDNALDAVDKVLEITPDFTGGYGFKASILAHLDRLKEAQALLVQYQEKRPEVKTTSDYEKVAPTIIKDVLLEGMIKAGLPAE
ncbi:MAG: adenylate/guanylate cyclase domain-containing protein [Deltaproteobacteria bacterium]|nr:adenylate/guanylate cyclase domain-containing protein [Deltaproteobacteria bacterium]